MPFSFHFLGVAINNAFGNCQRVREHSIVPCFQQSCDNGTACIPEQYLCDGWYSCKDKSDEDDKFCNKLCASDEMQCGNKKKCISHYWKCDGDRDCPDGSDEVNCPDWPCPDDRFKCGDGM